MIEHTPNFPAVFDGLQAKRGCQRNEAKFEGQGLRERVAMLVAYRLAGLSALDACTIWNTFRTAFVRLVRGRDPVCQIASEAASGLL